VAPQKQATKTEKINEDQGGWQTKTSFIPHPSASAAYLWSELSLKICHARWGE